jgi:hypothetical protein
MNIRLTILLVFVLALFGALALWFKPWEQDTPRREEPWAWRIDDEAIVHVEITNRGQVGRSFECSDETVRATEPELNVVYEKDLGRGKWYIVEGVDRNEVHHPKWAGTPLLLSGPKVNRVLSETIENPAQYGLDPPESTIVITEETGLSYEFWLGNVTPDEGYSYMRLVGDPKLFTVPEIWARVVNCLAAKPPFVPPPIELGYFYEEDFRDIQELEVTHKGVTVSYTPEQSVRTWYATVDGQRSPVEQPEWWTSQLQWFAQPTKPGGPETPGGWHVDETGFADPKYGLDPPVTTVRITTHEKSYAFYIGTGHIEVDQDDQPILDDAGNEQVLVHYAGLPDDPIVYVINRVRAERTFCLVTNPPTEKPYDCP